MRIIMMLMTIMSSRRVKSLQRVRCLCLFPPLVEMQLATSLPTTCRGAACGRRRCQQRLYELVRAAGHLPVFIFRAVEACALRFGVDVEDVLSAPGIGIGIILHRSQAPFFTVGHGVCRDRTQETVFLAGLALNPF